MRYSRTFAGLALASAIASVPGSIGAQAPVERPATHTVKRGDTLWDLAQTYLADPFQWPQIYQLNKDKIKDPHWIYPGQVFALPGGTVGAQPAVAAPSEAAPTSYASTSNRSMTVFNPAARRPPPRSREALLGMVTRTAVRRGDYEAAPYMWAEGGPTDGGSLIGSAEPVGSAITARHRPIGYREVALITMPRGVDAAAGQRLLVYRLGPIIAGQGQVVVPTGVVEVTAAVAGGKAHATVVTKFEDVFAGHGVTPLDTLAMPLNVFPTRVDFGIGTRVVWLHSAPQLPSEGYHLIVAATAAQGLVTGDQLSLRLPRTGEPGDEEIAVAQVTRVTPWGVSAITLDVVNSGVTAGMRAQVSAKMP